MINSSVVKNTTWLACVLLFCFFNYTPNNIQPAFTTPTTPTSDFIDNGDGTVTHKKTGLMWMRCSIGQVWTGSECSGDVSKYNWNEATKLKSNFAGHNDWRLPNIDELLSIVEEENEKPAINTAIFPDTPLDYA